MKNIVVATQKNIGYYSILEKSCKKHNIELIPLGLGKKWKGFHMKFELWSEYLSKLDDKEVIMLNDAYDIIMLQDANTILKRYKKFNKKLLFSSQRGILPNLAFSKFKKNVIANGSIIGEVKYIKKLIQLIYKYRKMWEKLKFDDQVILGYVMIKECNFFKKFVEVDKNHDFFFTTGADDLFYLPYIFNGTIKNLYMKKGELYNNRNIKPILLHLAGNINGNKYLKYIGYNPSNINLHGAYKFKQIFNLMCVVFNKNLHYFIFILLLIFRFYIK